MAEQAGTLVGHYRLLSTIGSGGFSTVYRAIDERLDAEVAVKVLAENHALDPEVRERFVAEAQLLRRIECPAVIAVHDVGETPRSQPYIVMAYADRGDLGSRAADLWVRSHHQVTPAEALQVAQTLTAGLGRAHGAGLVHRDVTPANLLLATDPGTSRRGGRAVEPSVASLIGPDERLLLSDLGFGKDLLASSGLTVGGGTAGFAAPEQQAPHSTVDARADIHAASAVLHWLFTRRAPLADGGDRLDGERLPAGLVSALRRGLAADPEHRHGSIDEWLDDVVAALGRPPAGSVAATAAATGHSAATRSTDGHATAGPATERPSTGRDGERAERTEATVVPAPVHSAEARRPSSGPDRYPTAPATGVSRHDLDHHDEPRRTPTPAQLAFGAVVLVLVAGVAAFLLAVGGSSDTTSSTADGAVTITAERDDLTLTVSGPETVALGDRIELTAIATGHRAIHWFAPAGGTGDGDTLVLQTGRAGVATITAVAVDDLGQAVTVEFPVTVE